MMDLMDRIEARLKTRSDVADYVIRHERTQACESFFIRRAIDQMRSKDVEHTYVTIYVKDDHDDQVRVGAATFEVFVGADDASVDQAIETALLTAKLALSPAYNLEANHTGEAFKTYDLNATMDALIDAFDAVKDLDTTWINSYELFVQVSRVRIRNSRGVDVAYDTMAYTADVVIDAANGDQAVEVYRLLQGSDVDAEAIRRTMSDAMKEAKDRLIARPTPKCERVDVVFSGEDVCAITSWPLKRIDAMAIHFKQSDVTMGSGYLSQPIVGNAFSITARAHLDGSSENRAFDREGRPIEDRLLIENGVVRAFVGPRQYCDYIGYDAPYLVYNYEVSPGPATPAELLSDPCLELVGFSDFSVNPMTGDFAGEIRLAYWHHDGKTTPVTGGSVSGNLMTALMDAHFSHETVQYNNAVVPRWLKLKGVSLSGVGETVEL